MSVIDKGTISFSTPVAWYDSTIWAELMNACNQRRNEIGLSYAIFSYSTGSGQSHPDDCLEGTETDTAQRVFQINVIMAQLKTALDAAAVAVKADGCKRYRWGNYDGSDCGASISVTVPSNTQLQEEWQDFVDDFITAVNALRYLVSCTPYTDYIEYNTSETNTYYGAIAAADAYDATWPGWNDAGSAIPNWEVNAGLGLEYDGSNHYWSSPEGGKVEKTITITDDTAWDKSTSETQQVQVTFEADFLYDRTALPENYLEISIKFYVDGTAVYENLNFDPYDVNVLDQSQVVYLTPSKQSITAYLEIRIPSYQLLVLLLELWSQ